MFSSRGLFRTLQCPGKGDCLLPACWFSHEDAVTSDEIRTAEYDPCTAGIPDSPPAKRRKIEELSDEDHAIRHTDNKRAITPPLLNKSSARTSRLSDSRNVLDPNSANDVRHTNDQNDRLSQSQKDLPSIESKTQRPQVVEQGSRRPEVQIDSHETKSSSAMPNGDNAAIPTSMRRPVTPPSKTASESPTAISSTAAPVNQEVLRPRLLAKGPDWQSRDTLLKVLHKNMVTRNNEIIRRVKQGEKDLANVRLLPQEVITLALNEEIDLARRYGTGVYQNVLKQRIHAISKLAIAQWRTLLVEKVIRVKSLIEQKPAETQTIHLRSTSSNQTETEVVPGLGRIEEVQILRRFQQPLEKLQAYGYVAQPPSPDDIRQAKETLKASDGWEKCDRCSSRFQVFPGRNEEGCLTSGGRCRYHWAKAGTGLLNRIDLSTGGKEAKHGCCNQLVGSTGCTEAEVHVFNVKDAKRLAAISQWKETPHVQGPIQPISFDCEMCYTTLGMEVVRVSAVSWPHHHALLDVLVRPYGEILDLNTRFSGVSRKAYAEAPAYAEGGPLNPEVLQKVSSPEVARQLLFDIITPDSPLIGHAIENDLNTLRIIHPFVVDTVLLYPHRRGLPMRSSLRNLAFDHLEGRRIQTGTDLGHDSKEDAVATGDLVTKAVRVEWGALQADGWKFENGRLVKGSSDDSKL